MTEEPHSNNYSYEDDTIKRLIEDKIPDFINLLSKIFDISKKNNNKFSIYFASKDTIQKLNKEFRDIDAPTDVLSFNIEDEFAGDEYLGEIICCPEILFERADTQKALYKDHFAYMILHSYLHLLGYEHENEEEYAKMEAETEKLMEIL